MIIIHLTHWKFSFKPTFYKFIVLGSLDLWSFHLGFGSKTCPYVSVSIIIIIIIIIIIWKNEKKKGKMLWYSSFMLATGSFN